MSQGLINPKALLSNKIDGVRERGIVRDIFIKKKDTDIFCYYSGSLVLSLLELYVKLSDFSFILGWKLFVLMFLFQMLKQQLNLYV